MGRREEPPGRLSRPEDATELSRRNRRGRFAVAAVVLFAALLWLGRDLPRFFLEKELNKILGAQVELGDLGFRDVSWGRWPTLELSELVVSRPEISPAIERLLLRRVRIAGDWRALARGRVETLEISGLEVELEPSRPLLGASLPGTDFAIAVLVLEGGQVGLAGAAPFCDFAADGRNLVGTRFAGADLQASCAALELEPWRRLIPGLANGRLENVALEVTTLGERIETRATLGHGQGRSTAGPAFELKDLAATLIADNNGQEAQLALEALHVELAELGALIIPSLKVKGTRTADEAVQLALESPSFASATASYDRDGHIEARLADLMLDRIFQPAADLPQVEGRLDVRASGRLEDLEIELDARPTLLLLPDRGPIKIAAGSRLHVNAQQDGASWQIKSDLDLNGIDQVIFEPSPWPLRALAEGRLDLASRSFQGRVEAAIGELADFAGEGRASAQDLEGRWRLAERRPGLLLEQFGPVGLKGRVTASGHAAGPWAEPLLKGLVAFDAVSWPSEGLKTADFTIPFSLRGSPAAPDLRFESAVGRLELDLAAFGAPQSLPASAGYLEIKSSGRADRRQISLGSLVFESPFWGQIKGKGKAQMTAKPELELTLLWSGFELNRAQALFAELLPDFELKGQLEAEVDVSYAGDWKVAGPWRLGSATLASRDGGRVVEGLTFAGELSAGLAADSWNAQLKGLSGGFLVLWDTAFGDFSGLTAKVGAAASGRATEWQAQIQVEPSQGLKIHTTLAPQAAGLDYELELVADDLEALHRIFLSQLFPSLLDLEVHGQGRLELSGVLGAAPNARGRLQLGMPSLRLGEARVAGLTLDLPLDLEQNEEQWQGERQSGTLAFSGMSFRGLELPEVRLPLWTAGDDFGLDQDLEVPFGGGAVGLLGLQVVDLLAEQRALRTGVRLQGLSLEKISTDLGFLPLEGELLGEFPRVTVYQNALVVDGGGSLNVFGGEVRIGAISGEEIFSRFPRLTFSAELDQIDLGQLTRRFDFGEMTGIVSGEIKECRTFRGVPTAFSGRLFSLERKGVKQTVDVKAVENLTVLGTGSRLTIFDRGVRRFFKRYRYAALGFTASLTNDRLTLRGLEHRGQTELFLRGRLPFAIDIVNAQPGKTVSFQTMVRRLQKLDGGKIRRGG